MLNDLLYRLRAILYRDKLDRDAEQEIRFHFERQRDKYVRAGLTTDEATRRARLDTGEVVAVAEQCREARGIGFIDTLLQDLRFGLRTLSKTPGLTAVVLITLALGIGATTAIFSVINKVLLEPLPYKDSERLAMVWGSMPKRGVKIDLVSIPDFRDWRAQNHVWEDMAASTDAMYTLTGRGEPAQIIAYQFSADFFRVLGVPPLLGRTFSAEEEQPGRDHVAVLSYALWQNRFGGDRQILGQALTLDGVPYTVIGVMPPRYDHPGKVELWTPLTMSGQFANQRGVRFLRVIARLKPRVTMAQAGMEMESIARRLASEHPGTNKDTGVSLVSLRDMRVGDVRPALLVLFGAVIFVLLIACANIASLLLSRAAARQKEIAIRVALGGGQWRLLKQFLTESLLLSLAGGALGLLVASGCATALVAMFPPTIANLNIPHVDHIPIDGRVLGFAALLSLITGIAFGTLPAVQISRARTGASLQETSRDAGGGRRGRRTRNVLVVAEVSLSVMLLFAAILMTRSFAHLAASNLGFAANNVLTFYTILPDRKYQTARQRISFADNLEGGLHRLPGVQMVGSVTFLPLSGFEGVRHVWPDGAPHRALSQPRGIWNSITPDYFATLGIPLRAGRAFTRQDQQGSTGVVILSETLARQLGLKHPVGQRVDVEDVTKPLEIVGLVRDLQYFGAAKQSLPQLYLPFAQTPSPLICWTLRTASNPMALANAVRRAVWAVDKDQPISYLRTMDQLASESLAIERVSLIAIAAFAALALILAIVGIYGVLSYAAAQRTQEVGIRMALGARPFDAVKLVIGHGLLLTLTGIVIGVAGALALARSLASLLYGVPPHDPWTLAGVCLLLIASALLASFVPARRTMRVDPIVALRYQ